uniref:Gustatory receptor n=1 Tax=Timema shepardi TaxID=629360 RepID=A0A7R9G6I9_TIMSH|nr:unnamed protein product [Timema shepardi]
MESSSFGKPLATEHRTCDHVVLTSPQASQVSSHNNTFTMTGCVAREMANWGRKQLNGPRVFASNSDMAVVSFFPVEMTVLVAQTQFLFLVLSLRQHLSYVNSRLTGRAATRGEIHALVEHHDGVVDVARVVNAAYSLPLLLSVTSVFIMLRQFSLQLLHSKLHFTACGLFPLDYTLIYSIVGASTTYLIILVQFQMSTRTPFDDSSQLFNTTDAFDGAS